MPKQKVYSTLAAFLPQPAFAMATRATATQPQSRALEVNPKERSPETVTALSSSPVTHCSFCNAIKVISEGNSQSELMFVGEAASEPDGSQELLTKMIEAMGVKREQVCITNVVKCCPPSDRSPDPDLETQIRLLKPKVIVALGATAVKNLLRTDVVVSKLRGQTHDYQGTKLIATFHPSYLLRAPSAKKEAWTDLQLAMKELGWK